MAVYDIDAATMAGDLRDTLLAHVKQWSDAPWEKRSAAGQREIAQSIDTMSRDVVRQMVEIVAAAGGTPVRGRLVKIAAKEVLQLQVDVIRSEEGRHQLIDGIGAVVMITPADASKFLGARGPVAIEPDQRELPVAAE